MKKVTQKKAAAEGGAENKPIQDTIKNFKMPLLMAEMIIQEINMIASNWNDSDDSDKKGPMLIISANQIVNPWSETKAKRVAGGEKEETSLWAKNYI